MTLPLTINCGLSLGPGIASTCACQSFDLTIGQSGVGPSGAGGGTGCGPSLDTDWSWSATARFPSTLAATASDLARSVLEGPWAWQAVSNAAAVNRRVRIGQSNAPPDIRVPQ